jgi:hypothetical protein
MPRVAPVPTLAAPVLPEPSPLPPADPTRKQMTMTVPRPLARPDRGAPPRPWPGSSNAYRNELVEAAWFSDWVGGAPEPARTALGTAAVRLTSGGVATSMRHDPVAYWSKALGFDRPVDRAAIAEVVALYEAAGTPAATIQIAPALLPADWDDILAEFGLTADSTWIKLAGPADAPLDVPPGLRVGPVAPADLDEWADVVFRGFGMPTEHLPSLAAASARRGTVQAFGVRVGADLVAGASLAIADGVGALLGAATLPGYRGLGAQTALIGIRVQAARLQGVHRVVAETGKPAPGERSASLDNLLRAGLAPRYERVNWGWTNPAGRAETR